MNKINFSKGLLRAYLVFWLVWFCFLFFAEHRIVLTTLGVDYWSVESASKRAEIKWAKLGCDNPETVKKLPSDCFPKGSFPANEVVDLEVAKVQFNWFISITLIVPAVILFFLVGFWFLGRWIVTGFKSGLK